MNGQKNSQSNQDQVAESRQQVAVNIQESVGHTILSGVLTIGEGVANHTIDSVLGRVHGYSGTSHINGTRITMTRQPYTPSALVQENADLRSVIAERDNRIQELEKNLKVGTPVLKKPKPAKKAAAPVKKPIKSSKKAVGKIRR